jgi:hypothetical protein
MSISHIITADNPAAMVLKILESPASKNNAPHKTRGLVTVGSIDIPKIVSPIGANTNVGIVDKDLKAFSKSCSWVCGTTGAVLLALVGATIAPIVSKYRRIDFFILKPSYF